MQGLSTTCHTSAESSARSSGSSTPFSDTEDLRKKCIYGNFSDRMITTQPITEVYCAPERNRKPQGYEVTGVKVLQYKQYQTLLDSEEKAFILTAHKNLMVHGPSFCKNQGNLSDLEQRRIASPVERVNCVTYSQKR
jgi:hypothetical protein